MKLCHLVKATHTFKFYREEHDMVYTADIDDSTQTSTRNLLLKKEDVNNICKHFSTPHLIYIRVTSTAPTLSGGWFTTSQKVNMTMDFRIWSDAKGDFTYTKRAMAKGTSTTVYAGGIGSASHAIVKALKKGLAEVEKDSVKIKSSMN